MRIIIFPVLIFLTAPFRATSILSFNYNQTSPGFKVLLRDKVLLVNEEWTVYEDGEMLSFSDGSLVSEEEVIIDGKDKHGSYSGKLNHWSGSCFKTNERLYDDFMIFTFELTCALTGTSIANSSNPGYNKVSSAFPNFEKAASTGMSFMSFGGFMSGWAAITTGSFDHDFDMARGGEYGGPFLLFDDELEDFILISPLNNFMVANTELTNKKIRFGVMGSIESIPANTEMKTLLVRASSLRDVFDKWGAILLREGGKELLDPVDVVSNYLGFWTDNGAFYYYNTLPGKTYEDTMIEISEYMRNHQIPVQYINYDSWFYYKGNDLGTKEWTGMTDIFPSGLKEVYNKTKLKVVAHNRYWATDNVYAKQNGGAYDFIVEEENKRAIPADGKFWIDLFADSPAEWGLDVYEQDWQDRQFVQMNATHMEFELGRDWLMQMGEGAARANVTIQYCMTLPREVLQSSQIEAVRRIRTSGDYILSKDNWKIGITTLLASSLGLASFKNVFWSSQTNPGNRFYYECMEVSNNTNPNQPWSLNFRYTGYKNKTKSGKSCINWFDLNMHWKFPLNDLERDGCRSIPGSKFADGKPFCFYNASIETPVESWLWEECDINVCEVDCARPSWNNNKNLPLCQEYYEPNPTLQATVALFSGGGVGFGDKLEMIDKQLIRSTCRADGLLLKITNPLAATPLQLLYMAKNCPPLHPHSCGGEIWTGSEEINQLQFYVILVAENQMAEEASLNQLDIVSNSSYVVYNKNMLLERHQVSKFPLPFQSENEFAVFHTSPQINLSGDINISVLGEMEKIGKISKQRMNLSFGADRSLAVEIFGSPREIVRLTFYNWENKESVEVPCEVGQDGTANLFLTGDDNNHVIYFCT